MPRYIILGAGRQGRALAVFLARNQNAEISLVDRDHVQVREAHREIKDLSRFFPDGKFSFHITNVSDPSFLRKLIRGHDVCISALPHQLNLGATKAAIAEGVHFCDYGFDTKIIEAQLALGHEAMNAGVTIVPNNGIAPGLSNILAWQVAQEIDCDAVKVYVGGLSQTRPKNAAVYEETFGNLLEEYVGTQPILQEGELVNVPVPSRLERLKIAGFAHPFEAFLTNSATLSVATRFKDGGKVRTFWEKTIRYNGHYKVVSAFRELGFLSKRRMYLRGANQESIVPFELATELFSRILPKCKSDMLIFQILFEKERRLARKILIVIRSDPASGLSAMQIATSIPVAVVAEALAAKKMTPGASLPEFWINHRDVMAEFKKICAKFFDPGLVSFEGI
ncbi:MAG: saccharopine dehydrogenase NADP-binding domain-containing protein [Candidatus Spechtbacteria bacterium]|nr:saccharopine dehydrogenase NADP-binding domain-containing protein [Candidatus Spechtbacteria bacterium]